MSSSEKYGLASLTNSLLSSATRYHNEEQIINAFESLGAQFSNYSLKDMSIVSLRTLSREPILRKALNIDAKPYFSPSVLLAASKLSEISNIGKPLVCTNSTFAPSGVIQC
jgi:predicted Zn-dependent peptidase